jgi:DNA-binding NarL/FixJ family response regulator
MPAPAPQPLSWRFVIRGLPDEPRRLLRHRALEATLEELVGRQPVAWVRAPSFSGKRTAIAAWLRRSRVPRHTTWLVRETADANPASRPLESFLTAATGAAGEPARTTERPAQQLFVVDLGRARVTSSELELLRQLAARFARVRFIVITDADYAVVDESSADLEARDLYLPEATLKSEFAANGVLLPASVMHVLGGTAADAALAGLFVASAAENPALAALETLQLARARAIAGVLRRVAPEAGPDLLVVLTLLPAVHEAALAAHDGVPEAFVALANRNLVERADGAHGARGSYGLPAELREVMRSLFIGHYLAHRERLHRAAAAIALEGGDPAHAITEFLAIPDAQAALAVFRERWSAAPLDIPRAIRMLDRLPLAELVGDLESAAAAWLLRLAVDGRPPRGPLDLRLRRAGIEETGRLPLPGRLSVWTAQIMSLLDRHETEKASRLVAEGFAALEHAPLADPSQLGHVHSTFLLAAARCAVYRGAMNESSELYADVLALPEAAEGTINTYRAHIGRALALTLNGEVGAAQTELDAAAEIAAGHAALHGRLDRIASWCQAMVWSLTGQDDRFDALVGGEGERAGASDSESWGRIAAALRAHSLLRKGFAMEAVMLARRAVESLDARHDHPVLRQWMTSVLGLALTASGQPGATLALTANIPANADHTTCLHGVRAFAHIAVGKPRAALNTTAVCIDIQSRHAKRPLIEVLLARAFAFEALGLLAAAEDAYLSALGIASELGIRLSLDPGLTRTIEDLHRRSVERAPLLVAQALRAGAHRIDHPRADLVPELSVKERRILQYLMSPLPLSSIAEALYLSPNTVKTHVRNIYRKLGVQSRKQAVDIAAGWGLDSPPL